MSTPEVLLTITTEDVAALVWANTFEDTWKALGRVVRTRIDYQRHLKEQAPEPGNPGPPSCAQQQVADLERINRTELGEQP